MECFGNFRLYQCSLGSGFATRGAIQWVACRFMSSTRVRVHGFFSRFGGESFWIRFQTIRIRGAAAFRAWVRSLAESFTAWGGEALLLHDDSIVRRKRFEA